MKEFLVLSLAFLLPGCGGPDVSKFVGGTWTGSNTFTANCGGQTVSGNGSVSMALSEGTDSDLAGATPDGCVVKFKVDSAGTTASLSNAPVTCKSTQNGTTTEATFNSFTLKTSDGHHLTMHSEGSIASGGQSCTFVDDA
ncbi:MAG TPA: hypothetical protein VF993_06750, partial [Myxococcales bacterium]